MFAIVRYVGLFRLWVWTEIHLGRKILEAAMEWRKEKTQ